jgi:acid phosphatase
VVSNTSAWLNLNNLISNGALPTNNYANSHPSIGNYFMLTTGQLLTTNDNSTAVWNVDNIVRRFAGHRYSIRDLRGEHFTWLSWRKYRSVSLRHNPFCKALRYCRQAASGESMHLAPLHNLLDLANGTLPEFSFIVPGAQL